MKMSLRRAMLLAFMCAGLPYAAQAADSTLVLVMGGEAYDGPPKFEVEFAGKVLGEGTVAAAIDTAEAGRFADQKDKTPYVQSFTFAIPADVQTGRTGDDQIPQRSLWRGRLEPRPQFVPGLGDAQRPRHHRVGPLDAGGAQAHRQRNAG